MFFFKNLVLKFEENRRKSDEKSQLNLTSFFKSFHDFVKSTWSKFIVHQKEFSFRKTKQCFFIVRKQNSRLYKSTFIWNLQTKLSLLNKQKHISQNIDFTNRFAKFRYCENHSHCSRNDCAFMNWSNLRSQSTIFDLFAIK